MPCIFVFMTKKNISESKFVLQGGILPCKTRLEEMRQSVREADVGQASRKKVCLFVVGFFLSVCLFYLFGWETSRRKGFFLLHNLDSGYISSPQVARRTSSLARRHQRGCQIQKLLRLKIWRIWISLMTMLIRSRHVAPKSSGEKSGRAACWHSGGQYEKYNNKMINKNHQ